MRKTILTVMAAVAALTAGAPAFAQGFQVQGYAGQAYAGQAYAGQSWSRDDHDRYDGGDRGDQVRAWGAWNGQEGYGPATPASYGGGDLRDREDRLGAWIRAGRDQGWLAPWQADRAWRALGDLRRDEQSIRRRQHGYLNDGQRFDLQARLDRLTGFVRHAHDEPGRRGW